MKTWDPKDPAVTFLNDYKKESDKRLAGLQMEPKDAVPR
jgi:hypothetical protein